MFVKFLRSIEIFLLFGCSLLLFTWGVTSQEITGFESRFYLFALEMQQNGISWFPTTYQEAYPDYPAAATFLIYVTAHIMGGLTKSTAVLPSAMASALTLVMTYLIGAKENKKWGWYAVFFLLLTFVFIKTARLVALDIYPTLFTACCFYFIYTRDQDKKSVPWVLLCLFLLFSFAFRGPIGLVMPAGVIASYYLLDKQFKILILFLILAGMLLAISTGILLSLAYHQGGFVFMHDVLRMEVLGRLHDVSTPFYFYFLNGLSNYSLSFICAFLVILGLFYLKCKRRKVSHPKLVLQLIGWIMVILIGMSLPADKKIRYILPVSPALALLAAYLFIEETKEKYFIYTRNILQFFLLFSPLILIILISVLLWSGVDFFNPNFLFGFFYFYTGLQIIALLLFKMKKMHAWRSMLALIIGVISFSVSYIMLIEPAQLHHEKAHAFVNFIEQKRLASGANLVFYKERADGLAIKYLINMPKRTLPIFVQSEAELIKIKPPAFFISSEKNFRELSSRQADRLFHVMTKDRLGHAKVVVFTR